MGQFTKTQTNVICQREIFLEAMIECVANLVENKFFSCSLVDGSQGKNFGSGRLTPWGCIRKTWAIESSNNNFS